MYVMKKKREKKEESSFGISQCHILCDVFNMHTYSFSVKLIIFYYVLIHYNNFHHVEHLGISYLAELRLIYIVSKTAV